MLPAPLPQAGACTERDPVIELPALTGTSVDQEAESNLTAHKPLYTELSFLIENETVVLSPVYIEGGGITVRV